MLSVLLQKILHLIDMWVHRSVFGLSDEASERICGNF